jgi:hypothetical protein
MKKFIALLVATFAMVVLPSLPAQAEGCSLIVDGPIGIVVCGENKIGTVDLPTIVVEKPIVGPTMTLPPITLPPVTLPPRPAVTVTVPGPTSTATKTVKPAPIVRFQRVFVPGPTSTATVAGPVVRKTVTITPEPSLTTQTATVTQTITASPTRQNQDGDATLSGENDKRYILGPFGLSGPEAIGLGFATLLAISGLIVAGMIGGFWLGYKDKEQKDTKFLRALLDSVKTGRGQHS